MRACWSTMYLHRACVFDHVSLSPWVEVCVSITLVMDIRDAVSLIPSFGNWILAVPATSTNKIWAWHPWKVKIDTHPRLCNVWGGKPNIIAFLCQMAAPCSYQIVKENGYCCLFFCKFMEQNLEKSCGQECHCKSPFPFPSSFCSFPFFLFKSRETWKRAVPIC